MIDALLIFPNGECRLESVDDHYPSINRALGVEWIEGIYTPGLAYYIGEERKLSGAQHNEIGEWLYRSNGGTLFNGDYLVGPMAVVGAHHRPDEFSCPKWVVDKLRLKGIGVKHQSAAVD
jgi:hypothetical protein